MNYIVRFCLISIFFSFTELFLSNHSKSGPSDNFRHQAECTWDNATYENNNSRNVFAIPSQRRKKIYVQDENKSENENSSKLYWVLFDNQIMKKSQSRDLLTSY